MVLSPEIRRCTALRPVLRQPIVSVRRQTYARAPARRRIQDLTRSEAAQFDDRGITATPSPTTRDRARLAIDVGNARRVITADARAVPRLWRDLGRTAAATVRRAAARVLPGKDRPQRFPDRWIQTVRRPVRFHSGPGAASAAVRPVQRTSRAECGIRLA